MNRLIVTLLALTALAGCARHTYNQPSAFPRSSENVEIRAGCERAGGTWNAVTDRCEVPY